MQFFASQHDNYQHFYRFSRFINFHRLDGWMGKGGNFEEVNEPPMILLINNNFFPLRGKTVSSDNFPSGLFSHEMMSSRCLITTLIQFFHFAVCGRRDSRENKPLISAIFISRGWKIENLIRDGKYYFFSHLTFHHARQTSFYAVRHVVCVLL